MGAGVRDAFPPPMCCVWVLLWGSIVSGWRKKVQPTLWVVPSLASLPRVGCVALANPALSKV